MDGVTEEEILELAKERFKKAQDAESENREWMIEDLEFVDGDQWPEDILRRREEGGRAARATPRGP